MANVSQIKLGAVTYELLAKYIQDSSGNAKTWSDIVALVDAGLQLVTDSARTEAAADGPIGAPLTTAALTTMGKLYLVPGDGTLSGSYIEWITVDKGTATTQYVWEKIGTTETDLFSYAKKGSITLTGTGETSGATVTGSTGAHTHSITPTTTSITYVTGATTSVAGAQEISIASSGAHTHAITPTTGTSSVVSVSGSIIVVSDLTVVTAVTKTGSKSHTHTVTVSDHSHTVNITSETTTVVTAVSKANSAGNHTHSIEQHTHSVVVSGNNYS